MDVFTDTGHEQVVFCQDKLSGLKENVILGHLVPAGTGFRLFQDSEVRINAPPLSEEADLLGEEVVEDAEAAPAGE